MSPNLRTAADRLYSTFKTRRPKAIVGCPCCTDSESLCRLLDLDLHQLSADALSTYVSSVFLTCGDEPDFRYLLPRIFEIASDNVDWRPSPEIVIGRLKLSHWSELTEAERSSIRNFLLAWLDDAASKDAGGLYTYSTPVDSIVCGIALAGEALPPYLELVFRYPAALAALYGSNAASIAKKGRLSNSFWGDNRSAGDPLIEFLLSQRVQDRIADQ